MPNKKIFLFIVISLLLTACGKQSSQAGDPAAGKALFNQASIDSVPSCNTCHSTKPDTVTIGPSLAGVAKRAESRVPGQTAEEYLRNCILTPNAYVVGGFPAGVMVQKYRDVLTEEQVNDLVAYLSTLK